MTEVGRASFRLEEKTEKRKALGKSKTSCLRPRPPELRPAEVPQTLPTARGGFAVHAGACSSGSGVRGPARAQPTASHFLSRPWGSRSRKLSKLKFKRFISWPLSPADC